MVNKTDFKEVTVCRNDLYTVGLWQDLTMIGC